MQAKALFCLGAIAFWLPEILLYAVEKHELSGRLVTFLLPCVLLVAYAAVLLIRQKRDSMPSAAIFMVLGVLFLGTLAMAIGATFLGAGFAHDPLSTFFGVLLGTLIPIYAFIGATYDGSLYALVGVTFLMPLLHLLFERRNWIVPRRKIS
jgi:hypothetical protein